MVDSGLAHAGTLVLPQRGKTRSGFGPRSSSLRSDTMPARAYARPALSQPLVSHLCLQDYIFSEVFIAKRKNVAIFEAARCFPASKILHFCSESSIEVLREAEDEKKLARGFYLAPRIILRQRRNLGRSAKTRAPLKTPPNTFAEPTIASPLAISGFCEVLSSERMSFLSERKAPNKSHSPTPMLRRTGKKL